MRVLQFVIIAIFLAVAMTSCDENGEMSSSMGFSQAHGDKDSSYIMEDAHLHQVSSDNSIKRINRNLATVNSQIQLMNSKLATEDLELDKNASEISKQLQSDLVRLKKDLEVRLSNVDENIESNYDIEKLEDEISQIQEEIDDWIEINFKQ